MDSYNKWMTLVIVYTPRLLYLISYYGIMIKKFGTSSKDRILNHNIIASDGYYYYSRKISNSLMYSESGIVCSVMITYSIILIVLDSLSSNKEKMIYSWPTSKKHSKNCKISKILISPKSSEKPNYSTPDSHIIKMHSNEHLYTHN